jgi:hypothetical protein
MAQSPIDSNVYFYLPKKHHNKILTITERPAPQYSYGKQSELSKTHCGWQHRLSAAISRSAEKQPRLQGASPMLRSSSQAPEFKDFW